MVPTNSFNRKNNLTRLVSLLILLVLLVSSLPQPALAATSATCAKTYTVVSGDTLSKIAFDFGVDTTALANANNLKSPYVLYIGQKLCIPASSTGSTTTTGSSTTSTSSNVAVSLASGNLAIKVQNFPKKSIYYIKVRSGSARASTVWYKVGMLRTRKNTSVEMVFKLPKQFRDSPALIVCLKNVVTDKVICEKATR